MASKFLSTVTCGFCLLALSTAAEKVDISFRVQVETLPEPKQVFITGNHPDLGMWDVSSLPLTEGDDGEWSIILPIEQGADIEYKFTRGTWAQEALASSGVIPPNHQLNVTKPTEVQHTVLKWKDQIPHPNGQITGQVVYHRNMEAEGLLPRDVKVWLPPGYDAELDIRYPVLYMHDGQQVFDPATSTHGIDWQVDEWATHLIESEQMNKIIIVANDCTRDRSNEYGENDDKDPAYRAFLSEQLKPFIDATYRTLPGREHTAVMGASMGGIASFKMVYKHSDQFSMAGCLSSAFWMDFEALKSADWPKTPVKIYVDNGGVGLEKKLQPGNDQMLKVLKEKGLTTSDDLLWCYAEDAEHNEEAWSHRVWMPLLYFFGIGEQDWVTHLPTPPPTPKNSLL